jgi:hypothetical protein
MPTNLNKTIKSVHAQLTLLLARRNFFSLTIRFDTATSKPYSMNQQKKKGVIIENRKGASHTALKKPKHSKVLSTVMIIN